MAQQLRTLATLLLSVEFRSSTHQTPESPASRDRMPSSGFPIHPHTFMLYAALSKVKLSLKKIKELAHIYFPSTIGS